MRLVFVALLSPEVAVEIRLGSQPVSNLDSTPGLTQFNPSNKMVTLT